LTAHPEQAFAEGERASRAEGERASRAEGERASRDEGERASRGDTRLLVIDPAAERWADARFADLPALLAPGDLVVVNDAATLPASLPGRIGDAPVELRLVEAPSHRPTYAVVMGAGDWRTRTEDRPAPPPTPPGTEIELPGGLVALVVSASPLSKRLVLVEWSLSGDALWRALYGAGRPIQYAHVANDYALWDVQTPYAGRPWAVEMPSAGRPLSWDLLGALARRGIRVAALTHAAGLSATGVPAIDAALPLPEDYHVPADTVAAIEATARRGGRVVAIGTSVVRALEGAAIESPLRAGPGVTGLRIGRDHQPRVVDAVVSGIHASGETHHELLAAFAGDLIGPAMRAAIDRGYRTHEHGDATIVLPGALDRLTAIGA
jgi:S-adenosylmethionine:tRNA ribosyltransferase-isomerase